MGEGFRPRVDWSTVRTISGWHQEQPPAAELAAKAANEPLADLSTCLCVPFVPLIGHIAHCLVRSVLDPLHERPVKLEARTALGPENPANILSIPVTRHDRSGAGDGVGVPVEFAHLSHHSRRLYRTGFGSQTAGFTGCRQHNLDFQPMRRKVFYRHVTIVDLQDILRDRQAQT